MNKLENKNRQNRVPLSPLKSANLLDINELADSPLKTGHIWGSNFRLNEKSGQGENPVFRITKKYVPLNR